jgi:TetR/AcrR family transcriptional regulator, transcriptional repressor for nem operon
MKALRHSDKRERLISAARELFRRHGFGETSLADIARESGVPVGNVYYYFKSKDDIAAAVIGEYRDYMAGIARTAEAMPTAKGRIQSMLDSLACNCHEIADSGCPMGSLCVEFGKGDTALREKANRLLLRMIDWLEQQFRAMDRSDARALAIQVVSTVQGASVLSLAMHDPEIFRQELERMKTVVETL